MEATLSPAAKPCFGQVISTRLDNESCNSVTTERADRPTLTRHLWWPSDVIRHDVVMGLPIVLDSSGIGRNDRRFTVPPGLSKSNWILFASLGGHAILRHLHPTSREQHSGYHAMRLIYQLAPRLRENLVRGFRRLEDLYIPRPARIGDEIHILPDDMRLNTQGGDHRWTVPQLAAAGREAAADVEIADPTEDDIIRLGVWAAARRRPIDVGELSVSEAAALVRLALFDLGPADEVVAPPIAEEVVGRLVDALEKHRNDTTEQFHQWFLEEFDNIVHQISKRRRPGGKIERLVVRQAVLESIFKSMRYVGDCVHLQAQAFADACRPRLSRPEGAAFSALYERQPYLGDMPLILLHEHLPFAREAVHELISNPTDPQRAGVFLRVLQIHAEMVRNKRKSEREYKRQAQHRNRRSASAVRLSLDRAAEIKVAASTPLFQEIAAELRELRAAKCACRTTAGWFAEADPARTRGARIVIIDRCTDCGHREEHRTTVEEFRRIGRSL